MLMILIWTLQTVSILSNLTSIIKTMSLFNNETDWDIIKSIFTNDIISRNRIIYKTCHKAKKISLSKQMTYEIKWIGGKWKIQKTLNVEELKIPGQEKKLMEELNMRFDLEKTYKENKNINTKIQCKDSLHRRNLEIISIYAQRFY